MKRYLGLLLSVVGGLVLMGCGDDDRSSGGRDSGGIIVPDGGPRPDTGGGRVDSGGGRMDSGGPPAGMCADPLMPFPTEAQPRCSAATRSCINACTTGACVNSCLMMDMTP